MRARRLFREASRLCAGKKTGGIRHEVFQCLAGERFELYRKRSVLLAASVCGQHDFEMLALGRQNVRIVRLVQTDVAKGAEGSGKTSLPVDHA